MFGFILHSVLSVFDMCMYMAILANTKPLEQNGEMS